MIRPEQASQNELLAELELAGATVHSPKKINCPFHSDKNPSSGIYLADDHIWRFKCHGCDFNGDIFDVRAKRTGKPPLSVFFDSQDHGTPPLQQPDQAPPKIYSSIAKLHEGLKLDADPYKYTDPDTRKVDMVVIRFLTGDGKKAFIQASPVAGGWIRKSPPKPLPLYNRSRMLKTDKVIVVEGEKCVHALAEIGVIATTSPGGANNAASADWTPLAGKEAYLWPDNDANGLKYMHSVEKIIEKLDPPARCLRIDPEAFGLPTKGDAADFLADLSDLDKKLQAEQVQNVLDSAKSVGISSEVSETIEAVISGKRTIIKWPWAMLGTSSKATYPGTITILCGGPGASKSLLLLEAMAGWHKAGVKCALYELEENRQYHLRRLLAQVSRNSDITDDEWVKGHPEESRAAYAKYASVLDSFGRIVSASPDRQMTLTEISDWIIQQAQSGIEIIAIDPITAASPEGKPWIADNEFLMRIKPVIADTGARLILITHPKKGYGKLTGLDELSGGAAYQRLPQTVLWLELHHPPLEKEIYGIYGLREHATFNRTIHVCKARNGTGTGANIACQFDPRTLKMLELGIIEPKRKG